MRRLGIVAVGLALVVGIVVGGLLGNPFDGKASAGGKPTRTYNWDQIVLPEGTWPALDADKLDGQHASELGGKPSEQYFVFFTDPSPQYVYSGSTWHRDLRPFPLQLGSAYHEGQQMYLEVIVEPYYSTTYGSNFCFRIATDSSPIPESEVCTDPTIALGQVQFVRSSAFALLEGDNTYWLELRQAGSSAQTVGLGARIYARGP